MKKFINILFLKVINKKIDLKPSATFGLALKVDWSL